MPRGVDRSGDPSNDLTREGLAARLAAASPEAQASQERSVGYERSRIAAARDQEAARPRRTRVPKYAPEPYNWESRAQS